MIRKANLIFFLPVLLYLGVPAVDARAAEPQAVRFELLAPGLEYRHDVRADGPLSIHVLRIDRAKYSGALRAGLGQGTVFGLEPLDGIVRRVGAGARNTPLAAINGDFFVIKPGPYQGDPRGVQIADGELVSRPAGNSFWISAQGELKIGPVCSRLRVVWPDGQSELPLGLNESRAEDAAVLFTPALGIRPGDSSTPAPGTRTRGGKDLVLESLDRKAWLPLRAGKDYELRVREIRDGGDTPLAPRRAIVSVGPGQAAKLPPVQRGDVVRLLVHTRPDLAGVQTAIGCGRVLVNDGKQPDLGPRNQPRHPRSMIGWNDRHLFFMVVDGRQPKLSIGMTYPEMAALVEEYGCTNAAELDGGGSSTLWAMGRILNSPSDGRTRPIANGLVLLGGGKTEP